MHPFRKHPPPKVTLIRLWSDQWWFCCPMMGCKDGHNSTVLWCLLINIAFLVLVVSSANLFHMFFLAQVGRTHICTILQLVRVIWYHSIPTQNANLYFSYLTKVGQIFVQLVQYIWYHLIPTQNANRYLSYLAQVGQIFAWYQLAPDQVSCLDPHPWIVQLPHIVQHCINMLELVLHCITLLNASW